MIPTTPGFKLCLRWFLGLATAQEQMWGWEALALLPYMCQHILGFTWLGRFPIFSCCARETSAKVVADELLAMASRLSWTLMVTC